MTEFVFQPAASFTERAGLFVSLTGGTNSGKTYSALRVARGIAGPDGKIGVLDTEGGRTLHLKSEFAFDVKLMDPPFRPERFSAAALAAEQAGYDALVIDSFSMEWVGLGGVLDWQAIEHQQMGGSDKTKGTSWIKPKMAHKAMVYSLLQRRIPIIFSIRGEETFIPPNQKVFKSITNKQFPFEVTVSFRLASDRKGFIDLSDPKSWKMEGAHQAIFRDGDRISEAHGEALAAWARGAPIKMQGPAERQRPSANRNQPVDGPDDREQFERNPGRPKDVVQAEGRAAAVKGYDPFNDWWRKLSRTDKAAIAEIEPEIRQLITESERSEAA